MKWLQLKNKSNVEQKGHDATCQWKGHDLLATMCVSMK